MAEDIPSIMPIMNSAFDPEYGEAWNGAQCLSMLAMPTSKLWLAQYISKSQYTSKLCGFAFTRTIHKDEELLLLATCPDYRRKGVANTLMNHIIDDVQENNRQYIFIEMRENNPAEAFYDQFSFKKINTRENYYRGMSGKYYNAITKKIIV